jgi:ABC-type glycerol-3-phosphate transport system substrate-binding protein
VRRPVLRTAVLAASAMVMTAGCGTSDGSDNVAGATKTITFVAAIYTDNTQKY